MRPEAVTEAPNSDPPKDIVVMAIPVDEPFVAWVPELLVVDDDEGLQQPVRLGLCHLEEAGPFGGVRDGSISGNHGPS